MHNDQVIIGDFGLAKSGSDIASTILGTPINMAPELMDTTGCLDLEYGSKADIWSLGIVFYQLLQGDYPFKGLNLTEIV